MKPKRVSPGVPLAFMGSLLSVETIGCITWPYARSSRGYGTVRNADGKTVSVHREICRIKYGEPPSKTHQAAHSCGGGSKGCVNPNHLRWASTQENADDRKIHGTHPSREMNGNAKLTQIEADAIRDLKGVMRQVDIAALFGVSQVTVSRIHIGHNWAA